jgi:archaellin
MRIIQFKDNELVISDEAYHIKCFRDLKKKAPKQYMDIFGYLYFMYHPASDYNYVIDESEKETLILGALGIKKDFFNNKNLSDLLEECQKIYKKMVVSTASMTIENNRKRINKIDVFLDELELSDDNIAKYTKAISDVTKLTIEISNAEKVLYKDLEEQDSKVRGKIELSIGDKGLQNL